MRLTCAILAAFFICQIAVAQSFEGSPGMAAAEMVSPPPIQPIGSELVAIYPPEGGRITLLPTQFPASVAAVSFFAELGILTHGTDAEPFDSFVSNASDPANITLRNLGSAVRIDVRSI